MISNSRPFFFRLLCLFLACLILANALIIPVRASVLLEVLAATTRNMIASLIRACGVYVADGIGGSLADGLETWEMLVDYVASKVPAEYLYINAKKRLYSIYDTFGTFDSAPGSSPAQTLDNSVIDVSSSEEQKPDETTKAELDPARKKLKLSFRKKQKPAPKKKKHKYLNDSKPVLYSSNGKFLRPERRNEFGWKGVS